MGLIPRVSLLAVMGVIFLFRSVTLALRWRWDLVRHSGMAIYVVVLVSAVIIRWLDPPEMPTDPLHQGRHEQKDILEATLKLISNADLSNGDWKEYGGDSGGTHFSPLQQLNANNIGKLTLAWSRRLTPDFALGTTPLKIDRRLYVCLSQRGVMALDAESGTVIWRSAAPKDKMVGVCRGVAFYRGPDSSGPCSERVIASYDATKLVAVDARDGKLCTEFGVHGVVSLLTGMGDVPTGFYAVTSAPIVVRGKVVVGGSVADSQYWGEPSGVIRAFSAVSGKLSWAWDMGNDMRTGEPPLGDTYTPSTPNSWSPMSADESLGLIYVPTGNATGTDIFGARRRPFDEKYSSSVVALDVMTGKPRWSFQTTHHDLWDYDVSSQPTPIDAVTEQGVVHALLQATKRGEVFVLDRVTGVPLYPVIEKPVPRSGTVPEEVLAPTQPFSDSLPSFRGQPLVEADMWGLTSIDQLWCRIKFREARYEGVLTQSVLQRPRGAMHFGHQLRARPERVQRRRTPAGTATRFSPTECRSAPESTSEPLGGEKGGYTSRGAHVSGNAYAST
jgi:quinoprotein glucose dehydrogenase